MGMGILRGYSNHYDFLKYLLLFQLFNILVLSFTDYALLILTLYALQCENLEKVQNEEMRFLLHCTRDTPISATRFMRALTSEKFTNDLAQLYAYYQR